MKYRKPQIAGKYAFIFCSIFLYLNGCASYHSKHSLPVKNDTRLYFQDKAKYRQKVAMLQNDLVKLNGCVDEAEAKQLAEESIGYSFLLAEEYKLVRPPFFHNILVRTGIKKRGLCYHWAEDLMKRLELLNLKSFCIHEGVAYRGSNLREHNTVIVTAEGQDFKNGMVLDPWRNSGDLFWVPVGADRYPWEKR